MASLRSHRPKPIAEMSQGMAFSGMALSGLFGSYLLLGVTEVYADYIVAINETGLFNANALLVGFLLAGMALLALVSGLFFQVCTKVFIDRIFEQ